MGPERKGGGGQGPLPFPIFLPLFFCQVLGTVASSGERLMTKRTVLLILSFLSLLALPGCGNKPFKPDLSTPEKAILSLEEAYRRKDIEAAVACKDFKVEAEHMMKDKPGLATPEILAKITETLELAYRAEMKKGFPNCKGVVSTFPSKTDASEGRVIVTEACRFPDGARTTQRILVAKTAAGWKVLVPVE
jgi:hypothetical protein